MPEPITQENMDKIAIINAIKGDPAAEAAWKRLMATINETNTRRSRVLKLVQEALQQLRLDMKYLVFDLEATRRERDALKGKFDEGN